MDPPSAVRRLSLARLGDWDRVSSTAQLKLDGGSVRTLRAPREAAAALLAEVRQVGGTKLGQFRILPPSYISMSHENRRQRRGLVDNARRQLCGLAEANTCKTSQNSFCLEAFCQQSRLGDQRSSSASLNAPQAFGNQATESSEAGCGLWSAEDQASRG